MINATAGQCLIYESMIDLREANKWCELRGSGRPVERRAEGCDGSYVLWDGIFFACAYDSVLDKCNMLSALYCEGSNAGADEIEAATAAVASALAESLSAAQG